MNRILHLITCTIISAPLWGQISINVTPGTFSLNGHPSNPDVNIHIDVVNNSPVEVSLLWTRIVTSAPAEWLTWICDANLCYLPTANACSPSKPNVLSPGEHMDFSIHVNPNDTEGSTGYDISFLDYGDPNIVLAQVQGEVVISNTVSTHDQNTDSKLTIFPNPTSDYFQVSETANLGNIELYNIVGSKVKSFVSAPRKQYFIGDLNSGIYLVRLVSTTNKVLKTIRLNIK